MVGFDGASFDLILDPAGRANYGLYPSLLECGSILFGVGSSNQATRVDVEELAQAEEDLIDLKCEFSGWCEDDGLGLWAIGVDEL